MEGVQEERRAVRRRVAVGVVALWHGGLLEGLWTGTRGRGARDEATVRDAAYGRDAAMAAGGPAAAHGGGAALHVEHCRQVGGWAGA